MAVLFFTGGFILLQIYQSFRIVAVSSFRCFEESPSGLFFIDCLQSVCSEWLSILRNYQNKIRAQKAKSFLLAAFAQLLIDILLDSNRQNHQRIGVLKISVLSLYALKYLNRYHFWYLYSFRSHICSIFL